MVAVLDTKPKWDVGDYVQVSGPNGGELTGWILDILPDGSVRILTRNSSIHPGVPQRARTGYWRERDYGFSEGMRLAIHALRALKRLS